MSNKAKFTATAVNAIDKETIQALRKEFGVTEKIMMQVIIEVAASHKDELGARIEQAKANKPKRTSSKVESTEEVAAA